MEFREGVSWGYPNSWMVYFMENPYENPMKIDDVGYPQKSCGEKRRWSFQTSVRSYRFLFTHAGAGNFQEARGETLFYFFLRWLLAKVPCTTVLQGIPIIDDKTWYIFVIFRDYTTRPWDIIATQLPSNMAIGHPPHKIKVSGWENHP